MIENEINTACPIFAHAVVIGDKRKYLSCLLQFKTNAPNAPGVLTDEVITYLKTRGSSATTAQEASKCPVVKKIVQEGIDAANKKAISNAQRVQRFTYLVNEFSVDSGELTPTLKLKRKIINQKYESEIASMYPPEAKL